MFSTSVSDCKKSQHVVVIEMITLQSVTKGLYHWLNSSQFSIQMGAITELAIDALACCNVCTQKALICYWRYAFLMDYVNRLWFGKCYKCKLQEPLSCLCAITPWRKEQFGMQALPAVFSSLFPFLTLAQSLFSYSALLSQSVCAFVTATILYWAFCSLSCK